MDHTDYNRSFNSYSLESIAQQPPTFFNELSALFGQFVGKSRKEIHDSDFKDELSALIKKFTKMSIAIDIGNALNKRDDSGYAIRMYPPSSANPVSPGGGLPLQRLTNIYADDSKGTIEGDLSLFKMTLFVDMGLLTGEDFTGEEHAAVTLHEIGHAYYGFSMIGRFATTNMALRDIVRDFDKLTTQRRTILITAARDDLGLPTVDPAILANAKDAGEVVLCFYTEQLHQMRSEIGADVYDRTMSEYLADQYCARFGGGRFVVTALDKLFNMSRGNVNYTARILGASSPAILNTVLATIGASVLNVVGAVIIGAIGTLVVFTMLTSDVRKASRGALIYDRDRDRFIRARNQVQLRLRTGKPTKEQTRDLLEDLRIMDEIIERTKNADIFASWIGRITSDNRNRVSQTELHLSYEQLGYNKLFDRAAALRIA